MRYQNTKEIIISHKGTRIVKAGEDSGCMVPPLVTSVQLIYTQIKHCTADDG